MIVLVFTGGTISMRHDSATSGAVPSLSGRDILSLAKGIESIASIEVDDWGAFPGPHMTPARMWALRERLLAHLRRPEVEGVVVTHGTDSLEESAYLFARSIDSPKPVVLTGAMRTSSDLGWDGPVNLGAAVRVAASATARGAGTLVVMNDRIYSGLDVTKSHTHMIDAFESPGVGPLGVVDDGQVIFRRTVAHRAPFLDAQRLAEPVDLIVAHSGADSRLIDASRAESLALVIAAMGRGNVPPGMLAGIDRWIAAERPVVITSRAVRGRVGPTYGYEGGGRRLAERGAILAPGLRPYQARVELMLGLGAGYDASRIRALFETREA